MVVRPSDLVGHLALLACGRERIGSRPSYSSRAVRRAMVRKRRSSASAECASCDCDIAKSQRRCRRECTHKLSQCIARDNLLHGGFEAGRQRKVQATTLRGHDPDRCFRRRSRSIMHVAAVVRSGSCSRNREGHGGNKHAACGAPTRRRWRRRSGHGPAMGRGRAAATFERVNGCAGAPAMPGTGNHCCSARRHAVRAPAAARGRRQRRSRPSIAGIFPTAPRPPPCAPAWSGVWRGRRARGWCRSTTG